MAAATAPTWSQGTLIDGANSWVLTGIIAPPIKIAKATKITYLILLLLNCLTDSFRRC